MTPFQSWLDGNTRILHGRSIDEVAHLAVLCGFSDREIGETMPTWKTDRQRLMDEWKLLNRWDEGNTWDGL